MSIYPHLEFPPAPEDRPYTFINMVATIDGKTVSGGRDEPVGDMGSSVDHSTMRQIQNAADAILIGAGALRSTPGLWYPKDKIRLVATRSGDLDYGSRFFTDAPGKAIVVSPSWGGDGETGSVAEEIGKWGDREIGRSGDRETPDWKIGRSRDAKRAEDERSDAERQTPNAQRQSAPNTEHQTSIRPERPTPNAQRQSPPNTQHPTPNTVSAIHHLVNDWHQVVKTLRQQWAVRRLLIEGGSDLNAQLLEMDLVDELFLTITPKVKLGRDVPTYAGGNPLDRGSIQNYNLVETHRAGDEMFLRYRRIFTT